MVRKQPQIGKCRRLNYGNIHQTLELGFQTILCYVIAVTEREKETNKKKRSIHWFIPQMVAMARAKVI